MNHKYNTIIRIPTNNGNFATITNSVIYNQNLSVDAKLLLIAILNKSDNWDINLEFYAKKFGFPIKRITKAISNLINNGYVSRKRKGKLYIYKVSEYGNLTSKEETFEVTVNKLIEEPVIAEALPQPVVQTEIKLEQTEDEIPTPEQINLIQDELKVLFHQEKIDEVGEKIAEFISNGQLTATNFNIEKIKRFIAKQKLQYQTEAINHAKKYDAENPKGTIAQQKAITSKLMTWLTELIDTGYIPTKKEITDQHQRLRNTITTANRITTGID